MKDNEQKITDASSRNPGNAQNLKPGNAKRNPKET